MLPSSNSGLHQHLSAGQTHLSRRDILRLSCAAMLTSGTALAKSTAADLSPDGCTLGFSTYGMKSMTSEDALRTLADIGYDAVELIVREGWDADSAQLQPERRSSLRRLINDTGLELSSLMEHVFPLGADKQTVALERLKQAAGVAHDLSPQAPPLIQTVLGGGNFAKQKNQLRDQLGAWAEIARATETTIAIKPHRGGIVSQPAEAVWLLEQLGRPERLRMVYDYSHYAFRNLPLAETVATALPWTVHIAAKDAVQEGNRVVFQLPGESGTIDFADLIRRFYAGGYRGDINCEVSGMVWSQPGYDPIDAARRCYEPMAQAFRSAGVPRRSS